MSTKVRKGNKGDASVLKPTLMCAVPLIVDRIYKNILDSVDKRGPNFRKIFEFCFNYKLFWVKRGMNTPILDKIVFNKIKALLGGKMDFILIGGAHCLLQRMILSGTSTMKFKDTIVIVYFIEGRAPS